MDALYRDEELRWLRKPTRVLVIGDLILDEYLDGVVNRISPEAPVPVHLVKRTALSAGGAANVALNIQRAGGVALLAGVCGEDFAAEQLLGLLKNDQIDVSRVLVDKNRPTVKKTRITASHQQLVRVDWEQTAAISTDLQHALINQIENADFDTLLISDYGKGGLPNSLLAKLIELGNKKGVSVVVDPKGKDYSGYAGCDLITPNYKEACEALGLDSSVQYEAQELASKLQAKYQLKTVLVTLGSKGMYGLSATDDSSFYLPALTREVFDVSGAGDTVVSMMALALASAYDLGSAMSIANLAAGRVVEKWGTQPIELNELKEAIRSSSSQKKQGDFRLAEHKYLDINTLLSLLDMHRRQSKKIVFTNGCFDLLHAGHLSYLQSARQLGDILVIGVNSDSSVRRLKGATRPIVSESDRSKLLAALECVSYVVNFDEDTPKELIELISPDVLVKGADYEISEIVGAQWVQEHGGHVATIEFVDGLSSSILIQRIKSDRSAID